MPKWYNKDTFWALCKRLYLIPFLYFLYEIKLYQIYWSMEYWRATLLLLVYTPDDLMTVYSGKYFIKVRIYNVIGNIIINNNR